MAPLIRPAAELDADDLYDLVEERIPPPPRPRTPEIAPRIFIPIVVPGLIDDAECPSCEKLMQPGAIVCTFCGFNMKTGEKPQRAAARISAGAGFARLAHNHKPAAVEDKKMEVLKLLLPVLALVVLVALIFTAYALVHKVRGPARAPLGNDAQVLQWLDDPGGKEIHAWFNQDPSRIAGNYSEKQALAKADELQSLGAKQVIAFGYRMTRALAIELPDNTQQRKALFDWENKFAIDHHYKPDTDVGQQYLLLNLN